MIAALPASAAGAADGVADDVVVSRVFAAHEEAYATFYFVFDQDQRRFIHLDGPCELFFGVSRERLQTEPESWQIGLDPFDRAAAGSLREELRQRRQVSRVFRSVGTDGRARWLRASLLAQKIDQRALVSGTVVEVDHDRELNVSNTFRQAVEHAREGLAVTDDKGCYLYLNREHVAMFGYESASELVGQPWSTLYTPEAARRIEREVFPVLVQERHWRGRLIAKRKDGSLFHEALALSLLPDGGIVCNCQDVTEQVQLSERLSNSETLFRSFLNTLPTGVTIRKLSGEYEFVNRATDSYLGREVVTNPKIGICLSDSPVFAYWGLVDQRIGRTGESERFDFPLHWGGRDWVLDVEKLPLRINSEAITHICTLVNDVTDQRRMEREAEQLARRRDEYLLMQREFISMVSHEFRTPLTSIHGAHYLLTKKTHGVGTEVRDDFLRLLGLQERALATLKELVDQVLLLNRIEHLSSEAALQPVRLAEFVRRIVGNIAGSLAKTRIALEIQFPEEETVPMLEAQMRAALENLISNSLKYSPDHTPVQVRIEAGAGMWSLNVTDRGRGIPLQDQKELFRLFHRASNVGNVPGTGLGLTIVRRVVEAHRGTLDFKSEVGVGTTFILMFPLKAPSAEPASAEPSGALPALPFSKPADRST